MKKTLLAILTLTLCLTLLVFPVSLSADTETDNVIIVNGTGDGVWEDGKWTVSLYPGEAKSIALEFHNPTETDLAVKAYVNPCSLGDGQLVFCFCSINFTLAAGGNHTDHLTATASGSLAVGTYSTQIMVESTAAPVEPEPDPDPDPDPEPTPDPVPHSLALSKDHQFRTVGSTFTLTATVRDQSNALLQGASIIWEKLDGPAEFASSAGTTDATGIAKAVVSSQTIGTSTIRATVQGTSVTSSVSVQWLGTEPVDPDPDPDPTPPAGSGTPGWAKALITILILVAGGAVYMVIRKRRQRRLEGSGDEDGEPVELV